MGYKRNIYELTPQEEMEENDILDIEAEDESGGIMEGNEEATKATEGSTSDEKPAKRRRGGSDEAFM